MDLNKLKEYYNTIESCSVSLNKEIDFEYVQIQISKIAHYTEILNTTLGEILIEKTRLEHLLTEKNFEYELRFTEFLHNNSEVQKFGTSKERKDYINYFLLKDTFKEIKNLEQELRDVDSLLELTKKKAKDLDKTYPKLKILWDTVQTEMKYIKKIGSDDAYINKVKNEIKEEGDNKKPIFTDNLVKEIGDIHYNKNETSLSEDIENSSNVDNTVTSQNNSLEDIDSLLSDL